MGRTLKAKEIYFLRSIPVGEDSLTWEVLKYKDNDLEEKYEITPDGRCSCPAGDSDKGCRHSKMLNGQYFYCNSKKEPYTLSDALAWKVAEDVANHMNSTRWTVFGELAKDEKIISRVDMLLCMPEDVMFQGITWQAGDTVYGFMRVGDVGITIRLVLSWGANFDELKRKFRKGELS